MAKKKETYEELMGQLEQIIEQMESEEVSLDKAMKDFEEGIKLCNKMYKILNQAEGKIKILTEQGEKDFIKVDE